MKLYQPVLQATFTLFILSIALYMTHHFIVPLAWSGVIAIATWPLYQKLQNYLPQKNILAASLMTIVVVLLIIIPLSWFIWRASNDATVLVKYLLDANKIGEPTPPWIVNVPWIGPYLVADWHRILSTPEGLDHFLAGTHFSLAPLSKYAKTIGLKAMHGFTLVFFAVLSLFFLFKEGKSICVWLQMVGSYCLGDRWNLYVSIIPNAVKATVIGSVFVGFGVGFLMGITYLILGVSAPVLLGLITGILSMIPFGAPVAFLLVTLLEYFKGDTFSAIAILTIGIFVMFIADHFVRPKLIGDATRLPFLAVLFGILGGIETMGLIGLFLGPVVMVLLMTLLNEPRLKMHSNW